MRNKVTRAFIPLKVAFKQKDLGNAARCSLLCKLSFLGPSFLVTSKNFFTSSTGTHICGSVQSTRQHSWKHSFREPSFFEVEIFLNPSFKAKEQQAYLIQMASSPKTMENFLSLSILLSGEVNRFNKLFNMSSPHVKHKSLSKSYKLIQYMI